MLPVPVKVDAEVAAEKFKQDLDWLGNDRAVQLGVRLVEQQLMYAVVKMTGVRASGIEDDYYVRLGAE